MYGCGPKALLILAISCFHSSLSSLDILAKTKPVVEHGLREKFRGRRWTEELYFKCSFKLHTDTEQLYQIHWFINNISVFISEPVDSTRLNETFLTEENGLEKLGVKINCAVEEISDKNISLSISPGSDTLYAGIKIHRDRVYLVEGGNEEIKISLTVPFGCMYYNVERQERQNCVLNIEVITPKHGNCSVSIGDKRQCGVTIRRNQWNETYILKVNHEKHYGSHDSMFYEIALRTQDLSSNHIWSGVLGPAVKINILNQQKDAFLQTVYNINRNMSKQWKHFFVQVIYSSTDTLGNKVEIQAKGYFHPENEDEGFICGVGLQSGRDVFIIDSCDNESTSYLRLCGDDIFKIIQYEGDQTITEVFLPTGDVLYIYLYEDREKTRKMGYVIQILESTQRRFLYNTSTSLIFFGIQSSDLIMLTPFHVPERKICSCRGEDVHVHYIDHLYLKNEVMCHSNNDDICSQPEKNATPDCSEEKQRIKWVPVFQAVAGNGERVYDAWLRDTTKLINCTSRNGCLRKGELLSKSSKGRHLTSPLLTSWDSIGVKQVKLEFYKDQRRAVALIFNGFHSDLFSWFSVERFLTSNNYGRLDDRNYMYFNIRGDTRCNRRFFIDEFLVINDGNPRCIFDQDNLPQLIYCQDRHNGGCKFADTMEIHVMLQD